jgi:hypothetical protein
MEGMDSMVAATGTAELLGLISAHIPDSFINDLIPHRCGRGRRQDFSAAQLWRVHLLSVLSPVHAFNQLVRLLPEQRAWRRFARLANRKEVPDVRMLHDFREQLGVGGLRQINEQLLQPLLPVAGSSRMSLALIDATDLEAASSGHKKSGPGGGRPNGRRWERGRSRRGKAGSFWGTRSTPSVCGSSVTRRACCWCR